MLGWVGLNTFLNIMFSNPTPEFWQDLDHSKTRRCLMWGLCKLSPFSSGCMLKLVKMTLAGSESFSNMSVFIYTDKLLSACRAKTYLHEGVVTQMILLPELLISTAPLGYSYILSVGDTDFAAPSK